MMTMDEFNKRKLYRLTENLFSFKKKNMKWNEMKIEIENQDLVGWLIFQIQHTHTLSMLEMCAWY